MDCIEMDVVWSLCLIQVPVLQFRIMLVVIAVEVFELYPVGLHHPVGCP